MMEMLGFGSAEEKGQNLPDGGGDDTLSPGGMDDQSPPDSEGGEKLPNGDPGGGGEDPLIDEDSPIDEDPLIDEDPPIEEDPPVMDDEYVFNGSIPSFYVSASGADTNDGLTEAAAFKTLAKAYKAALAHDTNKRVVVLSNLYAADMVWLVPTGITPGGPEGPVVIEGKYAALKIQRTAGLYSNFVLGIGDGAKVAFKHITINGNKGAVNGSENEFIYHCAMIIGGDDAGKIAEVTLDDKAVVTGVSNVRAGGIMLTRYGRLIMNAGSVIENCFGIYGGGVLVNGGEFIMNGGEIRNNYALNDGGGVYLQADASGGEDGEYSVFEMKGGVISGNISGDGGGVAFLRGTFTMSGGEISGNTATTADTLFSTGTGGGVYTFQSAGTAEFTMSGGVIYGNKETQEDLRNTATDTTSAAFYKGTGVKVYPDTLVSTSDTIDLRP
jgi:hypothetical protein